MKGEIAYQVHSVALHCMWLQLQGDDSRERRRDRETLEDATVEIVIMTDAIVAARTTENVDLIANPDHGS